MPNCHDPYRFLFLLFILIMSGCGDRQNPYKDYYFPLDQLDEGMIYIYEPANALGLGNEIWSLSTIQTDTGTVLFTRIFDPSHSLIQTIRETEVMNGMLADETIYYTRDTLDQKVIVPLKITRNALFPFTVPDTAKVYTYQASWREPGDTTLTTTLTRYRRYERMQTITRPNGEKVESVIMHLQEKMENDGEGVLSLEFQGEETYGKGLGLIAWKRILPTGDTIAFQLKETMPLHQYEAKYGKLE
ncbi:MAG: hypothetical protein K9I85_04025 [Saprospiraceae bacterium]|nr:hypothetical protein [Saprospiraceae bacterium]